METKSKEAAEILGCKAEDLATYAWACGMPMNETFLDMVIELGENAKDTIQREEERLIKYNKQ